MCTVLLDCTFHSTANASILLLSPIFVTRLTASILVISHTSLLLPMYLVKIATPEPKPGQHLVGCPWSTLSVSVHLRLPRTHKHKLRSAYYTNVGSHLLMSSSITMQNGKCDEQHTRKYRLYNGRFFHFMVLTIIDIVIASYHIHRRSTKPCLRFCLG